MLIGLCSLKASPGVTTTALGLAARWPTGNPVVIEADPAGGDVAARFALNPQPGLVSLAAATRHTTADDVLAEHTQRLPGGLRLILSPPRADQARAAVEFVAHHGLAALRQAAEADTVVADLGRLDHGSPALPLARAADVLLVLARPRGDELARLAAGQATVASWNSSLGLVLVGPGHHRREVETQLGVPVLATLPDDTRGASVLTGSTHGPTPDRSALGRATGRLSTLLLHHHGQTGAEPATRVHHEAPPVVVGEESP